MTCGWGGGMASWSPLSFDLWELQTDQSYRGLSFLGAFSFGSSWGHSEHGGILASGSVGFPGWGGAGQEDPFPSWPVQFV